MRASDDDSSRFPETEDLDHPGPEGAFGASSPGEALAVLCKCINVTWNSRDGLGRRGDRAAPDDGIAGEPHHGDAGGESWQAHKSSHDTVPLRPFQLIIHSHDDGPSLVLVIVNLLDEALCVLAADEHLERLSE